MGVTRPRRSSRTFLMSRCSLSLCWSIPSMFRLQTARARFVVLVVVDRNAPHFVWPKTKGSRIWTRRRSSKSRPQSLDDLDEVVDRLETALEKGLDEENTKFAEQLLVSSLLQRGTLFTAAIFNRPLKMRRRGCGPCSSANSRLNDLQRAVQLDENCGEAHLLIGKLQLHWPTPTPPGGRSPRWSKRRTRRPSKRPKPSPCAAPCSAKKSSKPTT